MPPKNKKRKRKWILLTVIVVAIAGIFIAASFRKKDDAISVQTGKVERRDITEEVVANGRVQPVLAVKISPEVSGEIIELPVKEAQQIKKGDLLLRIKPDFYIANRNSAEANYKSSLSDLVTSKANLAKVKSELERNTELFDAKLISESAFLDIQTSFQIAEANVKSSEHRVEMANASLERSEEELAKTTIVSPLDGTVSQLNSKLGERVVGTAQQAGTDVMSIVDLNEMEARVDIGEMDIVLIKLGQKAKMEVDAFRDQAFTGIVTEIANAARNAGSGGGQNQDATRFEVKIHIQEKANFRPGMSVTANVQTRHRTDALAVPIASVTTRPPKKKEASKKQEEKSSEPSSEDTQTETASTKPAPDKASSTASSKKENSNRPVEVVFVVEEDTVRQQPVKLGISDNGYFEIEEGLEEGEEIVIGGFLAISRELEDGKSIKKGGATPIQPKAP
jgi:HlyD family secretion protein